MPVFSTLHLIQDEKMVNLLRVYDAKQVHWYLLQWQAIFATKERIFRVSFLSNAYKVLTLAADMIKISTSGFLL